MNVFLLDPEKFQQWGDSFVGRELRVGDLSQLYPPRVYNTHSCKIVRWHWPHTEKPWSQRWIGGDGIWLYCEHGQETYRKIPIKVLVEQAQEWRRKKSGPPPQLWG